MVVCVLFAGVTIGCVADDGAGEEHGSGPEPGATFGSDAPAEPVGDPETGRALVLANGCNSCHDIAGRDMAGPTWQGLGGSEVELSDGSTVVADTEYLRRSIEDPGAEVVAGFANLMPEPRLTDDEIDDVVAYIQTL